MEHGRQKNLIKKGNWALQTKVWLQIAYKNSFKSKLLYSETPPFRSEKERVLINTSMFAGLSVHVCLYTEGGFVNWWSDYFDITINYLDIIMTFLLLQYMKNLRALHAKSARKETSVRNAALFYMHRSCCLSGFLGIKI